MIKPAYYRRRSDGRLFTAWEVMVMAKPNASRFQLFLPADPTRWHAGVMAQLDIDPVHATEPPSYDNRFQRIDSRNAKWDGDGARWVQKHVITEASDTIEGRRELRVKAVRARMERERDRGITVGGVAVSTTASGVARLSGAVRRNKAIREFVPSTGAPLSLTPAQIAFIDEAVDKHVQAMYDNGARLIRELAEAPDPTQVDIDSGW